MLVDAYQAYRFVNSHAPIEAQLLIEDGVPTKLAIFSQAVYPDGTVKWETDFVPAQNGQVDLKAVRDILGY